MSRLNRPPPSLPIRRILLFAGLFLALYAVAAGLAEVRVARTGTETAFQRLWASRGQPQDWVVLGASHALPLDYAGIPKAWAKESGQGMIVLAEVGAGPLYNAFVFDQAAKDVSPRHLLYVIDSFAFGAAQWNEARVADRKLLRATPLRLSTLSSLGRMVRSDGVSWKALADHATGFSKLNPPDLFSREDWRGREVFDRAFRPSRQASQARLDYLYPVPPSPSARMHYLDVLSALFVRAQRQGITVTVVKFPLPEAFRTALPEEAAFDAALRDRLAPLGIAYHDLSGALDDPSLYFDPDHLNRKGIERLYNDVLRRVLQEAG